jgi:integrase
MNIFHKFFTKKTKLTDAIQIYIEANSNYIHYSKVTIKNWKSRLKVLSKLNCIKNIYLETCEFEDIEKIKNELITTNNPVVINTNYLTLLRKTFVYFKRKKLINFIPEIENIKRTMDKEVEFITYENYTKLLYLTHPDNVKKYTNKLYEKRWPRAYWSMCILGMSGIRLREFKALKKSDLHIQKDNPKPYINIRQSAFNKKGRKLPVNQVLIDILKAMPNFGTKYVDPYYGLKDVTFQSDLRWIKTKFKLDFKFTPSMFRHSFCTWLAATGEVTAQELQAYMGHTNIKTTMKYINLNLVLKRSKIADKINIDLLQKIA